MTGILRIKVGTQWLESDYTVTHVEPRTWTSVERATVECSKVPFCSGKSWARLTHATGHNRTLEPHDIGKVFTVETYDVYRGHRTRFQAYILGFEYNPSDRGGCSITFCLLKGYESCGLEDESTAR